MGGMMSNSRVMPTAQQTYNTTYSSDPVKYLNNSDAQRNEQERQVTPHLANIGISSNEVPQPGPQPFDGSSYQPPFQPLQSYNGYQAIPAKMPVENFGFTKPEGPDYKKDSLNKDTVSALKDSLVAAQRFVGFNAGQGLVGALSGGQPTGNLNETQQQPSEGGVGVTYFGGYGS